MKKHVLCLSLVNKLLAFSLAILTSLAITSVSDADIIAIDFGDVAPVTQFYNQSDGLVNGGNVTDLVRLSDGTSTGISLSVLGATGNNAAGIAGNGGNTTDVSIFADGISSVGPDGLGPNTGGAGQPNNNILTFTFAGLDDTLTYDLVGGTSRAQNNNLGNFVTNWTTSSLGGTGSTTQISAPGPATTVGDPSTASGYINFTDLTSTSGELTITVTDNVLSAVSQLQLTAISSIPEPASAGLLGLAGLAFIVRRRK